MTEPRHFIQMGPKKTRLGISGTGGAMSWEGKAYNTMRLPITISASMSWGSESEAAGAAHWPMPASFTCHIGEAHRVGVPFTQTSNLGWRGFSRAAVRAGITGQALVSYDADTVDQDDASLPPMPTVPGNAKNLFTTFGVSPSNTLDQQTVLQNILNGVTVNGNTLVSGDFLVWPAGRYRHSGRLEINVPNVILWSEVATPAILHSTHAPNGDNLCALAARANNIGIYGFTTNSDATVRDNGSFDGGIAIVGLVGGAWVDGCTVRRCRVEHSATTPNGSAAQGIFAHHASNYLIAENFVSRTLADAIHSTQGCFNGRIIANTVRENGDDMIAVVSYLNSGGGAATDAEIAATLATRRTERLCRNILIANNDVSGQYWGRGITVVGGEHVTIRNNLVDRTCHGAGIMTAREPGAKTFGVDDVLIKDNIITDVQTTLPAYLPPGFSFGTTGHAALEMNASATTTENAEPALVTALQLKNVLWQNNSVTRAAAAGMRVQEGTNGNIGLVGFVSNTLAAINGAGISVTATPSAGFNIFTQGNTDDGVAVSYSGSQPPVPNVVGYTPPTTTEAITGLDWNGDPPGQRAILFANPHTSGLPIYPATYLFKVFQRQQVTNRSDGSRYYTTFFWGNNGNFVWSGGNANTYYGAHPYPIPDTVPYGNGKWEISVFGSDQTNRDNGTAPFITMNQWYSQAFVVSRSGSNFNHKFYVNLPLVTTANTITFNFSDGGWANSNPPSPCVIFAQAPNFGGLSWGGFADWEEQNAIIRGVQIYNIALTEAQILSLAALETNNAVLAQRAALGIGASNLWYLNMNWTLADITDKSGNSHHPAWVGASRPLQYTE